MRILLGVVVLSLCIGCFGEEPRSGNVAGVDSVELVRDALSAVLETYPPAHTRLALVQSADDPFGRALTESLRQHGYAVAEYAEPEGRKWSGAKAMEKPDGLALAYLVAGTGIENEIRVVIHVGTESLSRLYEITDGGEATRYIPKGCWSRRESGTGEGKSVRLQEGLS